VFPQTLVLLYLLLMGIFVLLLGLCAGSCSKAVTRPESIGAASATGHGDKQYANTYDVPSPVYRVPAVAPCWPGVWVGPPTAAKRSALNSGGSHQLVQRRRPSSISARITSHEVAR